MALPKSKLKKNWRSKRRTSSKIGTRPTRIKIPVVGEIRGCLKKKAYATPEEAIRDIRNIAIKFGRTCELYACRYCKGYHLASKKPHARDARD